MKIAILLSFGAVLLAQPAPMPAPVPPEPPVISESVRAQIERMKVDARANVSVRFGSDPESSYRTGARRIDDHEYEKAVEAFQKVIESASPRAEGALYWKAYALGKLGQTPAAAASLDDLKKKYPNSRWLNDAKALEIEIRQNAGQKATPEAENDEDLKLLALNGLMGTDPERVIPQVQKILASPKSSPRLKERALFVMAQAQNPKAHDLLAQYAKGSANPDLQLKAVEYLGAHGGKDNRALLNEIYATNTDAGIRRAVLHGYMSSHDTESLMQVARTEQNPALRSDAIRFAASNGVDIWPLYGGAASAETRMVIAQGLMIRGDVSHLGEVARTDKDPKVRIEAIHYLGSTSKEKSSDLLVSMYSAEQDKQARTAILHAFRSQNNAKALIDVARKESDPNLKRDAVRLLTNMESPEAKTYLMELLEK